MPNDFFKYKQFTVHQDQCAMKVCTDSSLFGALIEPNDALRMLDIGTGTGLLALMIAQKSKHAIIDAVEIDQKAAQQAQRNFADSPWSDRLTCHPSDIKSYSPMDGKLYDLIVSNPPFFKQNLKSGNKAVNLARHDEGLTLEDLFLQVDRLLTSKGIFWLLLPEYEFSVFEEIAKEQLCCHRKISVKNVSESGKLRVIGAFQRNIATITIQEEEVIVKNPDQSYTDRFSELLKDYYLIF